MLSWIGSRRARALGRIAMVLLAAACASGGDAVPPVSLPEPLAITGPGSARPRTRPAKPTVPTRASAAVRIPPARSSEPERAPKPPRADSKPPRAARSRPPTKVRVDSAALERAVTKRFAYQPLSLALAKRTRKAELADRVAAAVVYEAERNRISPSLLAAVLLIENAPFDTTAISSQGAVGLMQVMPVHIGSYGCPSRDLHSVEANVCHGARILHMYIRRAKGAVPLALKRYNGCVRGRNTPRCHRYPGRVLRTASKVRHDMLVSAAGFEGGLPDDVALGEPGLAVTVPSQPVLEPDTSITTTITSASECTTFMGCLKHRWTQR
jgi:soluble lytic murein transglycosylase-like protein